MSIVTSVGRPGRPVVEAVTSKAKPERVEVWEFANGVERPLSADAIAKNSDTIARTALQNAQKVDSYLRNIFQRDGWDGRGASLRVVVHTPDDNGNKLNNAYWDKDRGKIYLGDGDGQLFAPLGNSLDVLTHETVHAIVDSEVNLRYSGQQGGINEAWADVLGALADPDNDWLIGEDVFTPGRPHDAIRDLANPRIGHTRMIPKGADVDVHDLSGIPSLAAVKVAGQLGRADMGKIWYLALVDHLDSRSGFAGAARATLRAASALFGDNSKQFAAVNDAWQAVGVAPRYVPKQY